MPASELPVLPVTCLKTAEILNTKNAFRGHNTVIGMYCTFSSTCVVCCLYRKMCKSHNSIYVILFIPDFWTTKCTRCPDALDKLDELASSPQFSHISFVSICCDTLDGAREIIERENEPRWKHMKHYFMDTCDKERAKTILGFTSVPFYVMLNEHGKITQMGSSTKTFDFNATTDADKENENVMTKSEKERNNNNTLADKEPTEAERVFILDEDF